MRYSQHQTPPRGSSVHNSLARQPLQFIQSFVNQSQRQPQMIDGAKKRSLLIPQPMAQHNSTPKTQPIFASHQLYYQQQKNSQPQIFHTIPSPTNRRSNMLQPNHMMFQTRNASVRMISSDSKRGQILGPQLLQMSNQKQSQVLANQLQLRGRAETINRPPQIQQRLFATKIDDPITNRVQQAVPMLTSVNLAIPVQVQPLNQRKKTDPNKTQRSSTISKPPSKLYAEKDDELVKKFEQAILRTKILVQKYQNTEHYSAQHEMKIVASQGAQKSLSLKDIALSYDDGFVYRGQGFDPSTREGYGILCDPDDHEVYVGFWKQNQYHGRGALLNIQCAQMMPNFDFTDLNLIENGWKQYEGDFKNGKMHGRGVLILTNDDKFEGSFIDGVIQGSGTYYSTEIPTKFITGVWHDGVLVP